jgi:hypothetical protein
VPACESEDTAHDGHKHLCRSISLPLNRVVWQMPAAYIELGVALRSRLEGVLASLSLGLARVSGGAGPAADRSGGAEARGSAEGRAGGDGGHCGVGVRGCRRGLRRECVVDWRDVDDKAGLPVVRAKLPRASPETA